MSLRVVGYRDGHRITTDEGPSSAHRQVLNSAAGALTVGSMIPTVTAASGATSFQWRGPARKAMTVVGRKP